jgi:hypothetical protein
VADRGVLSVDIVDIADRAGLESVVAMVEDAVGGVRRRRRMLDGDGDGEVSARVMPASTVDGGE